MSSANQIQRWTSPWDISPVENQTTCNLMFTKIPTKRYFDSLDMWPGHSHAPPPPPPQPLKCEMHNVKPQKEAQLAWTTCRPLISVHCELPTLEQCTCVPPNRSRPTKYHAFGVKFIHFWLIHAFTPHFWKSTTFTHFPASFPAFVQNFAQSSQLLRLFGLYFPSK